MPVRIAPPQFERQLPGVVHSAPVRPALRGGDPASAGGGQLRVDLTATMLLSDAGSYDGGALRVVDAFGAKPLRLTAGQLLLSTAAKRVGVMPLTHGTRLSCSFAVQSLVRDDAARALLYDVDAQLGALTALRGASADPVVRLTGTYHALVRRWAEA